MAKGRRRVAVPVPAGGRGHGRAFVPGSAENASASAGFVAAQLGMCRLNAEQKQSMKRVIESSDVDPERAIKMIDDMAGSDTDSTDSGEMEELGPLHEAAAMGRMDTCKYLVEDLGFDINAEANNDSGMTPLACAVSRGKAIAVRYLLEKGADPDKEDIIGFTPLHYATKEGNDGLVRLLLSKGASVNASSSEGTPLHMAASHGKSAIVQVLLQNNADPNRVCADLGTPMTAAVLSAAVVCVAPGKISESAALKCMKLLVKAGADFNYANPDTPLVIATSKDLSECVKYLLEVGADANIPINHGGVTPLEIAADSGRRDLVEILFSHTYPIQSVSNWSVEGIIAHAKSKQLKEKEKQRDKESKDKLKSNSEKTSKEDVNSEKTSKKVDANSAKTSKKVDAKSSSKNKVCDKDEKAKLKSLGAKAVEEKDYASATKFYSEAIKVDPADAALYSNRSLCHLKSGEAQEALVDANACIRVRPDWPKGYYRKGAAFMALKDHKEACDAFMAAVKLDPENGEMHDAFWDAVVAMKKDHSSVESDDSSD
uniref:Uncharacterized protein n=1 Tax=Avena sativa TaxID=4498 RepID=A0ACD6A465_AVESA